jgi:8-amino-7-oxononanoate synthase
LPNFDQRLRDRLDERARQNRWRSLKELAGAQDVRASVDGRDYLNFCSNDYLGLANDPRIKQALVAGADRYGVGSGASHLVCGHSAAHRELEDALAEFCCRDRALLFSAGYMANLGIVQALAGRGDTVIEDRLNHASLLDAATLSRANMLRYQHADIESVKQQLKRVSEGEKFVLTDGVFSMDGDTAPLNALVDLCNEHQACLMVDDAHGFGVLGERGAGLIETLNLSQEDVPILVGTLGKAFGTGGAFVAGSEALIESLIQFARTYIYTTAMPPALACASLASLRIIESESWRREKLAQNIRLFRRTCEEHSLPLMPSHTTIQPLLVGADRHAIAYSDMLAKRGIWVTAIRPPTVPEHQSRLRITLNSNHSDSQILFLVEALVDSREELRASGMIDV